jgi:hypothetical protein
MLLTKEVTVNVGYRENPVVLDGMQGDSGRALKVRFAAGEESWRLPGDLQVLLQYVCADGTGGTYDTLPDGTHAYTVGDDDTLTIFLANQLFSAEGNTKLQITMFSGDAQISAFPVMIRVTSGVAVEKDAGNYVNLQKWLGEAVHQDPFIKAVLGVIPDGDEVKY